METLFTQYDDSPIIYDQDVDSEHTYQVEHKKTKAHLIISNFIKHGLNLQGSEAVFDHLAEQLIVDSPTIYTTQFDIDSYVDSRIWNYIVSNLYKTKTTHIDFVLVDSLIDEIKHKDLYNNQNRFLNEVQSKFGPNYFKFGSDGFRVYNSIKDVPRVYYSIKKQKFLCSFNKGDHELESKTDPIEQICSIRYQLLFERCRGYNFNEWIGIESNSYVQLVPVDSISSSSHDVQLLIGNLARCKDGDLCIQGSMVELKIKISKDCKISNGIYCYGQVVIVYGNMLPFENIFNVQGLTHPPVTLKNYLSHLNLFGGTHNPIELSSFTDIINLPSFKHLNCKWVVISDLYLDRYETIEALEKLFNSYIESYDKDQLPVGFIFMGNFNSFGFNFDYNRSWTDELEIKSNLNTSDSYSSGFDTLFKLLNKPKFIMLLTCCYFVFIPGPKDATLCRQRIPRNPLLNFGTNRFKERMEVSRPECKGRIIMATNPCRIRHWGRQMVFLRQDLMTQLLVDSVVSRSNQMDTCDSLVDMLVETLVGQSHLSPNRPGLSTLLEYDSSLLLHPLPDFICLGDTTSPAFIRRHGPKLNCIITNCESKVNVFKNIICYNSSSNDVQILSV